MNDSYAVTGTLTDATTVKLDQPLPVSVGKVRVTVEVVSTAPHPKQTLEEYLADLRARQAARGHVPRSREEIDAQVRAERDSWE